LTGYWQRGRIVIAGLTVVAIYVQLLAVAAAGASMAGTRPTGFFGVICSRDGAPKFPDAPSTPAHGDHDDLCCLARSRDGDAGAATLPNVSFTVPTLAFFTSSGRLPAIRITARKPPILPVGPRAPPLLIV
jgi:hypothetical protein